MPTSDVETFIQTYQKQEPEVNAQNFSEFVVQNIETLLCCTVNSERHNAADKLSALLPNNKDCYETVIAYNRINSMLHLFTTNKSSWTYHENKERAEMLKNYFSNKQFSLIA